MLPLTMPRNGPTMAVAGTPIRMNGPVGTMTPPGGMMTCPRPAAGVGGSVRGGGPEGPDLRGGSTSSEGQELVPWLLPVCPIVKRRRLQRKEGQRKGQNQGQGLWFHGLVLFSTGVDGVRLCEPE